MTREDIYFVICHRCVIGWFARYVLIEIVFFVCFCPPWHSGCHSNEEASYSDFFPIIPGDVMSVKEVLNMDSFPRHRTWWDTKQHTDHIYTDFLKNTSARAIRRTNSWDSIFKSLLLFQKLWMKCLNCQKLSPAHWNALWDFKGLRMVGKFISYHYISPQKFTETQTFLCKSWLGDVWCHVSLLWMKNSNNHRRCPSRAVSESPLLLLITSFLHELCAASPLVSILSLHFIWGRREGQLPLMPLPCELIQHKSFYVNRESQ